VISSKFHPGDIVFADRGLYRHYGVYTGSNEVIDFSPRKGTDALSNKQNAVVHKKTVAEFFNGDSGGIDNSPGIHHRKKTLARAKSELEQGSGTYDLIFNNCEHKAREWQTGEGKSQQVEDAIEIAVNTIEKAFSFFKNKGN
jgi:hypothetical protein